MELLSLRGQLDRLLQERRSEDSSHEKALSEHSKLNALLEQKVALTERELQEYKAKCTTKDQELRQLQQEHYQVRVELQESKQQLTDVTREHQQELAKLTEEHERQLKTRPP